MDSGFNGFIIRVKLFVSQEWVPFPFSDNLLLFPNFRGLGYNLSLFPFTSCLLCSGGLSLQTRDVINSIYCIGAESKIAVPGSFACSNLSIFTSAKESFYTLQQQMEKDNFLNLIFEKLFNINVTIRNEFKKRNNDLTNQLTFYPSSCNNINMTALSHIIYALSLDIVPNIPSLEMKIYNCNISLLSTDQIKINQISTNNIIGVVISTVIILLIFIMILFSIFNYFQSELHALPKEISWSFFDKLTHPWRWHYHGGSKSGYYSRKYDPNSEEFERVVSFLTSFFKKGSLKPLEITAIYNRFLSVSFINQWKIMTSRKKSSYDQFFSNYYQKDNDKMNVMQYFQDNILNFTSYNQKLSIPLIPALHGTDSFIAEKIAKTGFASLSSLDAGYFGKGIYFTTHLLYTLPYCCAKRNPAVILSYINMSNIFPVTEDHKGSKSLLGKPLTSGYNSHLVMTNKDGNIYKYDTGDNIICDEIVVGQESQILPAFIISLDLDSCLKEFDKWDRAVVAPISSHDTSLETIVPFEDQSENYFLLQ